MFPRLLFFTVSLSLLPCCSCISDDFVEPLDPARARAHAKTPSVAPTRQKKLTSKLPSKITSEPEEISYKIKARPNGSRYEGGWRSGRPHGYGVLDYPDGKSRFEGYFDNGVTAQGILTTEFGRMEGTFVNGKLEGEGSRWLSESRIRQTGKFVAGELVEGVMECAEMRATLKLPGDLTKEQAWAGPLRFEGKFVENLLVEGVAMARGERREGSFGPDGKQEGHGTVERIDGYKYEGEFRANLRHGRGVETAADGTVTRGIWRDDVFVGESER